MRAFLLALCLILVVGCHKPLVTPEEIDPIYRDYMTEAGNADKNVEEKMKKLEEARLKLKEIIPQMGQTRRAYGALYEAENDLLKARQIAEYWKVRASSRKFDGRAAYLKAFEADKEWPDPKEYSEYSTNKKLKAVSKNWRDRHPAASNRAKKGGKKEEKKGGHETEEKPAEASGGHE